MFHMLEIFEAGAPLPREVLLLFAYKLYFTPITHIKKRKILLTFSFQDGCGFRIAYAAGLVCSDFSPFILFVNIAYCKAIIVCTISYYSACILEIFF
jgi:hypothetical protein